MHPDRDRSSRVLLRGRDPQGQGLRALGELGWSGEADRARSRQTRSRLVQPRRSCSGGLPPHVRDRRSCGRRVADPLPQAAREDGEGRVEERDELQEQDRDGHLGGGARSRPRTLAARAGDQPVLGHAALLAGPGAAPGHARDARHEHARAA